MQKILVPTDFSNNALKALTYASEIAQKTGAGIYLLNVIEPTINMATMQADSSKEKVVNEISEKLNFSLQTVAKVYPSVKVIPNLSGGAVIASILDYAKKEKMDMIVMGTKGAGGLKQLIMGSVASGVVSKTKIPVLTVPASYEMEKPGAVLFATNQFEKNTDLLKQLIYLSTLLSATIHAVVFKDTNGDKNADLIYNEEQLSDYIHFLKDTFPDADFKAALLEGNDFEFAIDQYCNVHEVELIAMVTYPKSFLEKLLGKSVTQKMTFHSTIPILAIPAIGVFQREA